MFIIYEQNEKFTLAYVIEPNLIFNLRITFQDFKQFISKYLIMSVKFAMKKERNFSNQLYN